MPIEILMPALSPTMTEGNLAKWNVKEGDSVTSGQVIAEIETDKATMEVEAVDEGIIGKILIDAGTEGVAVNAPIALLLEEGEDKKALKGYVPKADAGKQMKDDGAKTETISPPDPTSVAAAPEPKPTPTSNIQHPTSGARVFASPLAKRIAAEAGVPIGAVPGSGPKGRIVKADVETFIASGGSARGVIRRNPVDVTEIPNTNMRKVIARRLTESKQTVPHFYLTIECELDRLLDVRKQLNDAAEPSPPGRGQGEGSGDKPKPAYKLSVNDLVIKASAMALKAVPNANASWTEAATQLYNNIDICVAVAIDGGLITPIIANADQKDVITISKEMKDLAKRAREGALKPEEFQGGSFSLSNLGMFGIKHFAAIINPPQGAILAIGAGAERAVVRDGQITSRTIMEGTLSVDHRVVDGAVGAEYMAAFKRYIENPALLLM